MKQNNIIDFKVRNDDSDIVLIFVDAENNELQRFNFSWMSAFRLAKEISLAVDFGTEIFKQKLKKVK